VRDGDEAARNVANGYAFGSQAPQQLGMAMRVKAIVIHTIASFADQDVPGYDLSSGIVVRPELELLLAEIAGDHDLEAVGGVLNTHGGKLS